MLPAICVLLELKRHLQIILICNDLCQEAVFPQTAITTIFYCTEGILKGSCISVSGIGHSDIRGLVTYRSMVRRERYRLTTWITFLCHPRIIVDRSNLKKNRTPSGCLPAIESWLLCSPCFPICRCEITMSRP